MAPADPNHHSVADQADRSRPSTQGADHESVSGVRPVAAAPPSPRSEPTPIVDTEYGRVRGERRGALDIFRGIPYAEPPTGPLRWKAPKPAKPWKGVFDARKYPAPSLQYRLVGVLAQAFGVPTLRHTGGREDCLGINIWTPEASSRSRRPVLFWVHGGGYFIGATSQYDLEALAQATGCVLVSVNYRLGTLGFFGHPALTAEDPEHPTNFGYLDIRAALQWVNRNIGAFGGDPKNITIFGESAGGHAILTLLLDPKTKGLFQRAIAQSAPLSQPTVRLEEAEERGLAIAKALGATGPGALARLRSQKAMNITAHHWPLEKYSPDFFSDRGDRFHLFPFVIDGVVLKDHPLELFRRGEFHRVPLLLGSNTEEGRFFYNPVTGRYFRTQDQWERGVQRRFGSRHARRVHEAYPVADTVTPNEAACRVVTDEYFLASDDLVASYGARHGIPVYRYISAAVPSRPALNCRFLTTGPGAYHTSELAFLLRHDRLHGAFFNDEVRLSTGRVTAVDAPLVHLFQTYWRRFAEGGVPADPSLPEWKPVTPEHASYLAIARSGAVPRLAEMRTDDGGRSDFWKDIFQVYRATGH